MTAIMSAFKRFLSGILDDFMLTVCILAPIIMGAALRFGIPILENFLCRTFSESYILKPYYLIFDLLLVVMTPMMLAFSGVMTTLEELDNGTAKYLMVTPVGKTGYLTSRICVLPAAGIIYSVIVIIIFGISDINLLMNFLLSVTSAVTGIIVSFLVVAFAGNKVEGMALTKLCGIFILGIPAVFFLPTPISYLCGVIPSYWFTLMAKSDNYIYALPTLATSAVWFILIYKKFYSKLV